MRIIVGVPWGIEKVGRNRLFQLNQKFNLLM